MENCIFCKIIQKEIPATILYEDAQVISFLDIHPVTKGHALVVPKAHHEWMQEAPDELVAYSFTKAKHLMAAQKEALGADYVMVSVVGKDVPHFHIHLIPKKLSEPAHTDSHYVYSENEMDATKQQIVYSLK